MSVHTSGYMYPLYDIIFSFLFLFFSFDYFRQRKPFPFAPSYPERQRRFIDVNRIKSWSTSDLIKSPHDEKVTCAYIHVVFSLSVSLD